MCSSDLGLKYKQFDFSVFFFGTSGNDIWNQLKWWHDFSASFQGAKSHTALYDSWTKEDHDATAPIQEKDGYVSTNGVPNRSEEHTSELQTLMRISYAVFCLKKKKRYKHRIHS